MSEENSVTEAGTHPCGVNGHEQQIANGILFCVQHWRMVSRTTQKLVYKRWHFYQIHGTKESANAYRRASERAKKEAEEVKS